MKHPTSVIVNDYLSNNPILCSYLGQGLINYSALARQLLPLVRKKNPKARIESVLIAIQRFKSDNIHDNHDESIRTILGSTELSLTDNIMEIVFERTKIIEETLLQRMNDPRGSGMCIMNETRHQIALFISAHLYDLFKDIPHNTKNSHTNLAAIGLHETTISEELNSQFVPGYFAHLTLLFAQNNVSIVELVSCHSHILIFVEGKNATRAYELLRSHQ